ncbi:Lipopolysaccharide-assembly, LptC-related [Thiomicrospira sp. ALE5]|nr:Lipopolysaccharide-assembly, LptC-related [Thiomicrospira sp. ALE5]
MWAITLKKANKTLMVLLALILAGLLTLLINTQHTHQPYTELTLTLPADHQWTLQSSQTWRIDYKQPNQSQLLISPLTYHSNQATHLNNPLFIRFGEQIISARAREGKLKNNQLRLLHQVELTNHPAQMEQSWIMNSDELYYSSDTDKAYGEGAVSFTHATLRQTGRDYVYNLTQDHLTLKHDVITYYDSTP